jgi:hypothetical protein
MEDFSQFLAGGQPKANPQANPVMAQGGQKPSTAWSEQELDRLINTESSKNPYAINKETKAIGVGQFTPETLAMLHKQGIKFDPFDPEQSRGAIRTYLDKLTAQTGSKEGALKAYGGFVTKDPSAYISKILVNNQPSTQTTTDDFSSFLSNSIKPQETQQIEKKPKNLQEAMISAQETTKPLKAGLASLGDIALAPVSAIVGGATYAGARALQKSPEESQALAQKISAPLESPIGKALGVTEESAYKNEAVRRAMNVIGQYMGESANAISQKTGIPKADIENMMQTLSFVVPELSGKLKGAKAQLAEQFEKQFPKMETTPSMAGVGAAQTQNATILKQAIDTASPELASQLKKLDPNKVNVDVLNRITEADSLPIPLQYTKGQQLQDPVLISKELNARGKEPELAELFNQQNKVLQENATAMKDRIAPDVFTESHVADAQGLIGNIEAKAKANADATKQAYENLKEAGGGKFPIDGQLFADNALNLLKSEDRLDYLPANFQRKLIDYQTGKKEMNFNLFENLRTDLASEIRKAQRAGDGNQAYVLGQVRSELEKLPMTGETAEIKALADKARGLAKTDFDLERQNKIYSDVVNGKADTKSFISKNVVNASNKDFADIMELIADDPIAKQHLASGTLDLIIRDSTDASGNFLTGKFAKHINNLQLNGKLVPLFEKEAATLQKIANASKIVGARPKGSFVNESNTLVGAMAEYAKSAAEHGTNVAFKGLPVGTVGRNILNKRAAKKELQETLNPVSGVQLKDLGK